MRDPNSYTYTLALLLNRVSENLEKRISKKKSMRLLAFFIIA